MALVEFDFPVVHACGHVDLSCGPVGDDDYHQQTLQRMLQVPCFTCDNLSEALDALKRGDHEAADEPGRLFVEAAIHDGYIQPLIEALETAQRAITEQRRQEGWWRKALCD